MDARPSRPIRTYLLISAVLCFATGSSGQHMPSLSWNSWALVSGRASQPRCVRIPANMTLCQNIGYTQMRLPNLLDQDTIKEVVKQSSDWISLKKVNCHPDLKLFLCSLYSPVCLDHPIIWPCKSLCQLVKAGCEKIMLKWGFPWPEMARCSKFPVDNDMCIKPQSTQMRVKVQTSDVCQACQIPDTYESIVNRFCHHSEFVMKVKIRKVSKKGNVWKLTATSKRRKMKIFHRGTLKKKDLRRLTLYIRSNTIAPCMCGPLNNTRSHFLVMGKKVASKQGGYRLELSFLTKWPTKKGSPKHKIREFRSATIAIRTNPAICKQTGMQALNMEPHKENSGSQTVRQAKKTPRKTHNKNGGKKRRMKGGKKGNRKSRKG